MYCELFKLREPPFRLTPDPQFLFASRQHARAKAYMESTIWLADGFVVVTGEIGSGKTTLIESFLEELPEDIVLAHISQTQLSPVEFLQALLVEFGFEPFQKKKIELLSMLRDFLVEQYANSRKVLLIIDEAQNLSRKVLEEVRLLSGIEAQKEKLLRIILAGQPEMSDKLDSPKLEQLAQRVRLRFHLNTLSKRETHDYIRHRLEVAGAEGRRIFDDDAMDMVFRYAGGVPRLTNILCDTAMLCAFAEERDTVDAELVKAAVEELQWVEYAERRRDRDRDRDDPSAVESTGRFAQVGAQPTTAGRFDILFRDEFVTEFTLPFGRTILGRTSDNDLQIRSKFVSRHHAQVTADRDRVVIEDLNSTNGIMVRQRRVTNHTLEDGDIIQIGEHKLLFRRSAPVPAPADDWREDEEDTEDEAEDSRSDYRHDSRFESTVASDDADEGDDQEAPSAGDDQTLDDSDEPEDTGTPARSVKRRLKPRRRPRRDTRGTAARTDHRHHESADGEKDGDVSGERVLEKQAD
jgi:general secretion pathway protein A